MTALAVKDDLITSLLRDLSTLEDTNADALLERAELLLKARIADFDDRAASTEPELATWQAIVKVVEADAVARVYRNPTARTQEADGTYSYSVNLLVASGLLDILPAEWQRLGIDTGGIGSSAGEMDGYAKARYGRPDLGFQRVFAAEQQALGYPLGWW